MSKEWSLNYDGLKGAVLSLRGRGVPITPGEMQQCTEQLNRLKFQLRPMVASPLEYGLVASEAARREVLLENLNTLLLSGAVSSRAQQPQQVQPQSQQPQQRVSESDSNLAQGAPRAVYNPVSLSNKGLSLQQQDMLRTQDALIDEIGSGVDRLFHKAQLIGEEASVHSRLLDNLEDNVDVAARALREEAKHASEVRGRAQSCYLYMCVAAEVLIIVLLIVAWFAKG